MIKKIFLTYILLLNAIFSVFSLDAWIRINQLGYVPNGLKNAVLISETPLKFTSFSVHDALTNELIADYVTFTKHGEYLSYSDVYTLDFSSLKKQGAFYIKVGNILSPIIYIDKNIFYNSADFVLNYIRLQRSDNSLISQNLILPAFGVEVDGDEKKVLIQSEPAIESKKSRRTYKKPTQVEEYYIAPLSKKLDIEGGWLDASFKSKSASIAAETVFQLLFAYRMNPDVFVDMISNSALKIPNAIPDVLDEAKWGLDWLLKMNPSKEVLYHQVGDDRTVEEYRQSYLPIYRVTNKPQGLFEIKNKTNGVASVAAKFSAAFALGASIFEAYSAEYSDTLSKKAIELYEYGKKFPGVCQSVPGLSSNFMEEDNWTDDMELAATQLYYLTFESEYLRDALKYGRMEPVLPWVFSDSCKYYQWFPFATYGHFLLSNIERPTIRNEFLQNIKSTLHRADLKRKDNPFQLSVPIVQASNNYVVALANQCALYRQFSKDSSFLELETMLVDWLFGCNPWGTSMVVGLPDIGVSPRNPYHGLWLDKQIKPKGGLVSGPVLKSTYEKLMLSESSEDEDLMQIEQDSAVYYDISADFVTNKPSLDGTASLLCLLSSKQNEVGGSDIDNNVYDKGSIVRTDISKKQINLVFVGHRFVDGRTSIQKLLKKQKINASFFFTGDFLRDWKHKKLIKKLQKDGHYIGAHSDKYLQYLSNNKRLWVTKKQFKSDLKANFEALKVFNIEKSDAPFFMAPNFVIHDSISQWTKESGLKLLNSSPGLLTNADASIPEMRENYYSSLEIYNNIMTVEAAEGLNGKILVFNIGSDNRRTDKFYTRLASLLQELKMRGYTFTSLYESTAMPNDKLAKSNAKEVLKNKKRKNK